MAHGGGRCCFGVHEVVFCVVCCMLCKLDSDGQVVMFISCDSETRLDCYGS